MSSGSRVHQLAILAENLSRIGDLAFLDLLIRLAKNPLAFNQPQFDLELAAFGDAAVRAALYRMATNPQMAVVNAPHMAGHLLFQALEVFMTRALEVEGSISRSGIPPLQSRWPVYIVDYHERLSILAQYPNTRLSGDDVVFDPFQSVGAIGQFVEEKVASGDVNKDLPLVFITNGTAVLVKVEEDVQFGQRADLPYLAMLADQLGLPDDGESLSPLGLGYFFPCTHEKPKLVQPVFLYQVDWLFEAPEGYQWVAHGNVYDRVGATKFASVVPTGCHYYGETSAVSK